MEHIEFISVLGAPQPVKNRYIVHKVDPFRESLMLIAYRYKVSEASIKRANDLPFGDANENLFIIPELFIPYTGQKIVANMTPQPADEKASKVALLAM